LKTTSALFAFLTVSNPSFVVHAPGAVACEQPQIFVQEMRATFKSLR